MSKQSDKAKPNSSRALVPSKYERTEIVAIHEWKNPSLSWFDQAMAVINKPLDLAGNVVMNVPGIDWVMEKAFGGALNLLNDGASWSVRPGAVFADFGPDVQRLEDIHQLDLKEVDKAIGYLAAKYKSLALAEGAAAGAVGLPGIPPDVVALLGLNLRAIGEYATYCGFDVNSQQERLFALNVLGLASSPTDAAKTVAMAQLVKIAKDVARKRTWKQLEEHLFVRIVQQIAKALSVRLTKAKLAQVVPAAGAAVGGGFNAYYTAKVCDAAYFLYRERFLAAKYGPQIIEAEVAEAADGDYGDGYEQK